MISTFRQKFDCKSNLFAFWNEYIIMVTLLLQFTKAERTSDWSLHRRATARLCKVASSLPYGHDSPSFQTTSRLYGICGSEIILRAVQTIHSRKFLLTWAWSKCVNRHSKSTGGIIGNSQNPQAVPRPLKRCVA